MGRIHQKEVFIQKKRQPLWLPLYELNLSTKFMNDFEDIMYYPALLTLEHSFL